MTSRVRVTRGILLCVSFCYTVLSMPRARRVDGGKLPRETEDRVLRTVRAEVLFLLRARTPALTSQCVRFWPLPSV